MTNLLILPDFSIKRALANLHGSAARSVAWANAWAEQVPNAGLFSRGNVAKGVFAGNIGGLVVPVFAILQKGVVFGRSLPACWAKGGWADRGRAGSRHARALPRRAKGMRGEGSEGEGDYKGGERPSRLKWQKVWLAGVYMARCIWLEMRADACLAAGHVSRAHAGAWPVGRYCGISHFCCAAKTALGYCGRPREPL